MNTGIIATRYATALLKLVDETGSGEAVVAQVQTIGKALDEVPGFRRAVNDPAVSAARKISLFEAALSPVAEPVEAPVVRQGSPTVVRQASQPVAEPVEATLTPELRKFVELLLRNGRLGDVRLVFTTFITEYYRSRHIKRARLVVADSALLDSGTDEPALSPAAVVRQSSPTVVRQSSPTVVRQSSPTVVRQSSPTVVRQSSPTVVRQSSPTVVRQSSPTVVRQSSPTMVRQAPQPVAEPVEAPTLESRLRDLIEKKTGCKLILKTEVNPSLIGGFVFEVEDTVLDASVTRQLDIIRRQFIEKNRRIV